MSFSKIIYIKADVTNFTMKADWVLDLRSENTWKRERKEKYFYCLVANVLLGVHLMKVNKDFQHCTLCSFWVHCVESVLATRTNCGISFNLFLEEKYRLELELYQCMLWRQKCSYSFVAYLFLESCLEMKSLLDYQWEYLAYNLQFLPEPICASQDVKPSSVSLEI